MQTGGGDGPGARQSAGEWDDPWRPGPQTPAYVDPEPGPEGVIYPASQAHVSARCARHEKSPVNGCCWPRPTRTVRSLS